MPEEHAPVGALRTPSGDGLVAGECRITGIRRAIDQLYEAVGSSPPSMNDMMSEIAQDVGNVEVIDDEEAATAVNTFELKESADEAPVVRLVNMVLVDAIRKGASDLHWEPYEKTFRIRFRIDGVLHEMLSPPKRLEPAIISRLKIMANLDISERRLPQDGRIKLRYGTREIDFRVSVLPTIFGEKAVLRILDKEALQLDLTKLGFDAWSLEKFTHAIHQPYGMVLITGPTGSGKTTTLYSAIHTINSPEHNIMTAEDPVEYNLKGVNQVQINEVVGRTFAGVLRSFLRQDPDVILVGEMRDYETIETAITAAETGHLVLSTLHTMDATETVNRIISVFPPHQQKQIRLQLAAVLKAVISLRLLPRADGLGRVPATEVLISTAYIRDCIENKEKTKLIKDAISQGTSQYGMQTFDQSIFWLYERQLITQDEALRWASNPDEFKLRLQGISTTADVAREEMARAGAGGGNPAVTRFGRNPVQ